jgi:outer membrane protein TolC
VPFWGKRALRRDVAEAEALMVEGRSNATWNEIASKIKAAYAQYYVIARTEALTQEILAILLNLEKTAQARYLANLSTQQSAIEAQAEQTRTRTELVAIQTERRNLQYRINALLRRPPNAPLAEPQRLRTVPPPVKLDYAALEERLMIRNPQLFTDGAGVTAAAKGRELTYRNRWPDGSIGGVIFQTQDNRFVLPGLAWGIEIPLQQPRRRSEERQAEAKVAAAQERKNATENQLRSDLAQNLAALEGSIRTERLLETALVPQAEMSFQSAQAGYESTTGGMNEVGGIMTFDMLLDAQRQVRKAKLDLLKAQAETQVRLAEIERIVGEDL